MISHESAYSRIKTRSIQTTTDTARFQEQHDWKSLQSIITVTSRRRTNNKLTEEIRYFIKRLNANVPKRLVRVIRTH